MRLSSSQMWKNTEEFDDDDDDDDEGDDNDDGDGDDDYGGGASVRYTPSLSPVPEIEASALEEAATPRIIAG